MKLLLQLSSTLGLLLTIIPSLLYFTGYVPLSVQQHLMLAGTVLWFATAPFWMNKKTM
ncbi:MAG: hypothetical protein AAF944_03350 [Bacteroidota bacterium]